jgi:hypothetical protein
MLFYVSYSKGFDYQYHFLTASERNLIRAFTEYEQIIFVMTMEDLTAQLSESLFIRIHRSFIVSMDKINLINEDFVVNNQNGNDKSIRIWDKYRDAGR